MAHIFWKQKIKIVFCLLAFLFLTSCSLIPGYSEWERSREQEQTKEAEEAVRTRPEFREIQDRFDEIRLPDSFVLVSKRLSFKAKDRYLVFEYYSELSFDEVEVFFQTNLERQGWKVSGRGLSWRSDRINFEKKPYKLSIDRFPGETHANYVILFQRVDIWRDDAE